MIKYTKEFERYWRRASPERLGDWQQFDRHAVKAIAWKAWQAAGRARVRIQRPKKGVPF